MPRYSDGFAAEAWFHAAAKRLRILDRRSFQADQVLKTLTTYLPRKTEIATRHIDEDWNVHSWFDLVLKADVCLRLENIEGESLSILVDVTSNPRQVFKKYNEMSEQNFAAARRELGFSQQWILLISPEALPGDDEMIDRFYEVVDLPGEVKVVDMFAENWE